MATSYATLAQVREFGKFKSGETDDDDLLTNLITRVSAMFDAWTGYHSGFVPSDDETRYYDADAIAVDAYDDGVRVGDLLLEDTLVSITSLTNGDGDATAISSDDYFLMPRSFERKHFIRIKEASSVDFEFDTDGYVVVAGKYGYTLTTPEDVRQAVIEAVLHLYDRAKNKRHSGNEVKQSMDGIQITLNSMPKSFKAAVDQYKKKV